MERSLLRSLVIAGALLGVPCLLVAEDVSKSKADAVYRPSPVPDRIILTWDDDPATTQAVTWRTDASVSRAQAEIAEATDGPIFAHRDRTVPASTELLRTESHEAHYHSVRFSGLKPDTLYCYRVGDGANWSEWNQFRTAVDGPAPLTFLYFGDSQNDLAQFWSRVIRQAVLTAPDARFLVHAGDLINDTTLDSEWGEWHAAGGWVNGAIPSLPTAGNHEYKPHGRLSPHWRPQFTLPDNGAAGFKETNYYLDIQGVRMVSLDTTLSIDLTEPLEIQAEWLEKVLADNPNRWTILTFHYPIYAWATMMPLSPLAIDSGGGNQGTTRFAGQGQADINFRLDGLDVSGISHQAPRQDIRLQASTEAIAEFRVDSALYTADKGGTAGGQVELITRSGTNSFRGSLFEYFRNDKLSSRGPFDPSELPPLRLNQYGGSLGGPIVPNRTFFFVAYEGLRQRVGTTLIGNVPSDEFRAEVLNASPELAPILAGWPQGNRRFSDEVSQFVSTGSLSADEDSVFTRVDHRLTDSTTLFARFSYDEVELSSPSGRLLDKERYTPAPINGSLNISHVFSPTLFNSFQMGVNRIHNIRHYDSSLWDAAQIFSTVQVPGFERLNQVGESANIPTSYTVKDDLSWTRGAHSLKFGAEVKRVDHAYSQRSENSLTWPSREAFIANELNQVNLIGGVPMRGLYKTMFFGYVQDQWKVRPDLTLNLGLRYDYFNGWFERYGRAEPFDLESCGGPCPRGAQFVIPVKTNFSPRVSVAWSPGAFGGGVVIRTGFGLYRGEGQLTDTKEPSDNDTERFTLTRVDFPDLSYPIDRFIDQASEVAVAPRMLARDRGEPTVAQWGLQVQFALPADFVLDTGYVGSQASHQFSRTFVNVIDPATGERPLDGYGQIEAKENHGNASFHGWQTSLQRRFRSGFQFAANYLWSHATNDGSVGSGEAIYPQNVACRHCERASSDEDIRHVFNASMVYELPFGRGRRYLKDGGAADLLFGGWQISGLLTARTGRAVNVAMSRSSSALPDGNASERQGVNQRPDLVPGEPLYPAGGSTTDLSINPAAFTEPADGAWGNAGRNLIRGPKLWQVDIGLSKNFRLTERFSFDFRAEAFNVFNRAQFGVPNGNFSSANFGQITSTVNSGVTGSGTPRQFQFALRLNF